MSPKQVIEITQFLREAVINALKHADPDQLEVAFILRDGLLRISVINNGQIAPPETWRAGTGTKSMVRRIQALGGELKIDYRSASGKISVTGVVPVKDGCKT
ncbi:MAG: hypothetical protein R3E89_08815 [Thiolinea sp.]